MDKPDPPHTFVLCIKNHPHPGAGLRPLQLNAIYAHTGHGLWRGPRGGEGWADYRFEPVNG